MTKRDRTSIARLLFVIVYQGQRGGDEPYNNNAKFPTRIFRYIVYMYKYTLSSLHVRCFLVRWNSAYGIFASVEYDIICGKQYARVLYIMPIRALYITLYTYVLVLCSICSTRFARARKIPSTSTYYYYSSYTPELCASTQRSVETCAHEEHENKNERHCSVTPLIHMYD